jgi:hypothetical protein
MDRASRLFAALVVALVAAAGAPGAAFGEIGAAGTLPAFPGAEGAGAFTPGGRGGAVFVVTSLSDHGPGSLREAVEADGPRTIVFAVAGLITLETPLEIDHPFVTIAGQAAPGGGVCIRGQSVHINTHDIIIRYLRFRRGNLEKRDDALGGNPVANVIVDHVSASWGLDENLSLYRYMLEQPPGPAKKMPVQNLTIQWTISSEALDTNNHAFGGTWGGDRCSFHHNLFACNTGRNPSIGMGGGFDFRNNVLFNWRHRSIDGGDGSSRVNLVANYFKPGPATQGELRSRICRLQPRWAKDEHPGIGLWFVAGNYVEGRPDITANNWLGGVQFEEERVQKGIVIPKPTEAETRSPAPFPSAPVTEQSAEEAYARVLAQAGASLPRRDAVDLRVIEAVRTGRPTFRNGIIVASSDVGGWPEYPAAFAPADADADGMPDAWEKSHGLDPSDRSDAVKDTDHDGYTSIEEYLNGTDPNVFLDYTKPENNKSVLHRASGAPRSGR